MDEAQNISIIQLKAFQSETIADGLHERCALGGSYRGRQVYTAAREAQRHRCELEQKTDR